MKHELLVNAANAVYDVGINNCGELAKNACAMAWTMRVYGEVKQQFTKVVTITLDLQLY